jgi:hypothetical protein
MLIWHWQSSDLHHVFGTSQPVKHRLTDAELGTCSWTVGPCGLRVAPLASSQTTMLRCGLLIAGLLPGFVPCMLILHCTAAPCITCMAGNLSLDGELSGESVGMLLRPHTCSWKVGPCRLQAAPLASPPTTVLLSQPVQAAQPIEDVFWCTLQTQLHFLALLLALAATHAVQNHWRRPPGAICAPRGVVSRLWSVQCMCPMCDSLLGNTCCSAYAYARAFAHCYL